MSDLTDQVPDWMATALAKVSHDRQCGYYDGARSHELPFQGAHREHDLIFARIHIADLCRALGTTPQAIAAIVDGDSDA